MMLAGEQQIPPVWGAFGAVEDAVAALCDPLPPYVVLHGLLDEPLAFFDSLDDAFAEVRAQEAAGFLGDVIAHSGTLTDEQKKEVFRGS